MLRLFHHDGDYFVLIDELDLMATRAVHSEEELARLTCADLKTQDPRVLIGGLGLGFTMRAALDVLPRSAEVVVAEKFECIVRWNHDYLPDLQGEALRDPRLSVVHCDVWDALEFDETGPAEPQPAKAGYDVVLLDVDNGPNATCIDANARLYEAKGLVRIRRALRPGGQLAVWATDPDPRFERQLRHGGFAVETKMVRARGERGARHYLFLARL